MHQLAAFAALLLIAIVPASAVESRTYLVRGVIQAPYSEGSIIIRHEAVDGYMPAMTMPFRVTEADVKGLRPGDNVEFELEVGERSRATHFRKVSGGTPAAASAVKPSRRLRPGDVLPPFSLIDQDGKPVTEADLRNHATIVSFIFTRCPIPEFCPLTVRKLREVQSLAKERAAPVPVQVVTFTLDPEFDRPPVLKAYGESVGAKYPDWRFATGKTDEIDRMRALFSVHAEAAAGSIEHTLATALIGPDLTVIEIWRGNGWKPAEVFERSAHLDQTATAESR